MFLKDVLRWIYLYPLRFCINSIGPKSIIRFPYSIEGGKYINIGEHVTIFSNCHLQAIPVMGSIPSMNIGNQIRIWYNMQISCANSVTIEDGCTFAANCFITDVTHQYEDISVPAFKSRLVLLSPVVIGEGSWIGRNVTIMGVRIGKHCVIGNSCFVTKDIPDYCVVVGSPARIVKRYNPETHCWQKTDKDGIFIANDN